MTKAEKAYQDSVRELGCITHILFYASRVPCEIHHRLSGGRRMGHDKVLGLCPLCHRGGLNGKVSKTNPLGIMSRDHSQRRFEKHYDMTEQQMQDTQDELIEQSESHYKRIAA